MPFHLLPFTIYLPVAWPPPVHLPVIRTLILVVGILLIVLITLLSVLDYHASLVMQWRREL